MQMRRINLKLSLGLMLGTAAAAALIYGLHCLQYQRIAGALLWQARHAEEQGQVERMVRYLHRYLEFMPRDVDEKAKLGATLASDQYAHAFRERRYAFALLESVVTSDPTRLESRRLAVKMGLELGKLKPARDHLKYLWEAAQARGQDLPGRELGELEGYWGQLHEDEGNPGEAIVWNRRAVKHAPDLQSPYSRLAHLLRAEAENDVLKRPQNEEEADRLLDDLVVANENSFQAYLARWRYRREFDLIQVEGLNLGDEKSMGEARALVKGTSPPKDAGADIAEALERAPESAEALIAAADRERLLNHRPQALVHLRRGLEILGKQGYRAAAPQARFQLLWHLSNVLLDELLVEKKETSVRADQAGEAAQRIEQVRKTRYMPAAADYLEGRLRLQERRWAEAAVLLERARPALENHREQRGLINQLDIFLGQCYEQLEEPGQMYAAYERVYNRDTNSSVALLGMGAAQWMQGKLEAAMVTYDKVMTRPGVPTHGWVDIARLEIQRQLQKDRDQRDWTRAEAALDRGTQATKKAVEITLLRSEILVAKGKIAEAEKLVRNARAAKPEREVELWAAEADLATRSKDRPRALKVLDEAQEKLGDKVELRLARVRAWADDPGPEAEKVIKEMEKGWKDFKLDEQARLLDGVAEGFFRIKNNAEARRICVGLCQHPHHDSDLRLRLLCFDLAMKDGDEPGMQQALGMIQAIDRTDGAYTRYGQALRLIWLARNQKVDRLPALNEARRHLDRAGKSRPNWPPLLLASSAIHEMQGNLEDAIVDLKQAIQLGETSPAVAQRLVGLLCTQQRYTEADEEMKHLKDSLKVNSELGRLAASLALRRGDPARALRLASDAVAVDTRDFRDHVWKSQILIASGAEGEAQQKLEEAIRLAPAEPEPYVALVRLLVRRKALAQADQIMREASQKVDPRRRALLLAQCHEVLGHVQEAAEEYRQALAAQPDSMVVIRNLIAFQVKTRRLQEAEDLLRRVVERKVKAADNEVDWARRSLALLLANGTDFQRFLEALHLVGLDMDANGRLAFPTERITGTENIRTLARVLATQQQRQLRDRAIEFLEELQRFQALLPEDHYVLALLYDARGNVPQCLDQLRSLVLSHPESPQYQAQYTQTLIRERHPDAEAQLGRLIELETKQGAAPGAYATVDLRVRLLEAQEQKDKALELVKEHIGRKGAQKDEILLLVSTLTRQKRYPEAFEKLAEAWQVCSRPEAVGGVSVALLRSMKPAEEQCQRVEAWLKEAITRNPRVMALHLHLADLYDQRGRLPEAEDQYRIILRPDNEPNNVVALNNLAWLLAHKPSDGAEALQRINTAVTGLGRQADLLDTRGVVYLALGKTEEALADFREATAEAASPARLFHLARAHLKARDTANARKALGQAKTLGLKPESLHPVEQALCRQMLQELQMQ